MNNWFNDVFLSSLFERYSTKKSGFWLTEKQTNVCLRNMEVNNYRIQVDFDLYYRQLSGSCVYSDGNNKYDVFLKYSKKNKCGYITFSRILSEEEKNQIIRENYIKNSINNFISKIMIPDVGKTRRKALFSEEKYNEVKKEIQKSIDYCYEDLNDPEIDAREIKVTKEMIVEFNEDLEFLEIAKNKAIEKENDYKKRRLENEQTINN